MENYHQGLPEKGEHQSSQSTSPNSNSNSSSSSSKGAATATASAAQVPSPPVPQPPTPKSIARSVESSQYPTTFIQADTSSFKQVVQMLTGSAETAAKHAASATTANPPPPRNPVPPAAKVTGPKKPAFKLYERRSSLKNFKMISPLLPTFLDAATSSPAAFSPRKQPEILSPSMLDLPSLVLSPVTPLIPDPFNRSPQPNSSPSPSMSAEERAIAEKGFYLHPSPRTTPRDAQPPRLLPLFPVTSPRISSAAASSP